MALGSMVVRISTFSLPRTHVIRPGEYRYGHSSPRYHRPEVVAVNSLRHSPAQMEGIDPFSLVSDELSILADRLRAMDKVEEVPELASAVQYFFNPGAEGKRLRPTVLLLMATALGAPNPKSPYRSLRDTELRQRQQLLAAITEMIHKNVKSAFVLRNSGISYVPAVGSLLHDDVLDDADTRRGIKALNFVMGNKVVQFSVLAGDFLLSRACTALASLNNTEVLSLMATVIDNLVRGETMQVTTSTNQRCSMEYYMKKTYYKTASLISNSCKAIALLAGQTPDFSVLAYQYGKNLGLSFQLIDDVLDFTGTLESLGKGSFLDIRHGIVTAPILFAIKEYPELREVVEQGFDDPKAVSLALEYLGKSSGIQKTKDLAKKHADLAAEAIDALPYSDDDDVRRSRQALVDLTNMVVTRTR